MRSKFHWSEGIPLSMLSPPARESITQMLSLFFLVEISNESILIPDAFHLQCVFPEEACFATRCKYASRTFVGTGSFDDKVEIARIKYTANILLYFLVNRNLHPALKVKVAEAPFSRQRTKKSD